nr:MAG TPA: hypothetical protein [Caudoviricetes sp.]
MFHQRRRAACEAPKKRSGRGIVPRPFSHHRQWRHSEEYRRSYERRQRQAREGR